MKISYDDELKRDSMTLKERRAILNVNSKCSYLSKRNIFSFALVFVFQVLVLLKFYLHSNPLIRTFYFV